MIDGVFRNPTTIFFGPGPQQQCFGEIARHANGPVLLHYGRRSARDSGVLQQVIDGLEAQHLPFVELGGVSANPELGLVREGVALCKSAGLGFVLAVGGGSVIDSAKAIAAGACHDGDVLELITGETPIRAALPLGTVLTMVGAGSESSPAAVISDHAGGRKLDFASEHLRPRFSVLNPEHTLAVGHRPSMNGILDAMCHLLERYFSNTQNVGCSDRLAEGLLLSLIDSARALPGKTDDYCTRANIMWACKLAQDEVTGLGRKQDWSSHVIAHAIGGRFDCPHGTLVTVIMIAWMKFVVSRNPKRLEQFGERVFGLQGEQLAPRAVDAFEQFVAGLDMPVRLSQLEVALDEAGAEAIAQQCAQRNPSQTIGNYVRLTREDVTAILNTAR